MRQLILCKGRSVRERLSSFSSMESLSSRSRDKSRSRDLREIPQHETSYSWRKNFNKNLEEKKTLEDIKAKEKMN